MKVKWLKKEVMKLQSLPQIEKSIEALPYVEQIKLIERIVHRLRQELPGANTQKQTGFEKRLAVMAADFQIQSELRNISI